MSLDPQQQIDFDKSMAFVLEWEGGYTNDPEDSGGPTNLGIVQTEYDAYRQGLGLGTQSVRWITHSEAQAIYLTKYWLPAHCGLLAWPACCVLFDSVVNTGLSQGVKFLQRTFGVAPVDGFMGPLTIKAMGRPIGTANFVRAMCDKRKAFYNAIVENRPSQHVFLAGWINRVRDLEKLV